MCRNADAACLGGDCGEVQGLLRGGGLLMCEGYFVCVGWCLGDGDDAEGCCRRCGRYCGECCGRELVAVEV